MAGINYKSQGVKNTEVNHDLHPVINKTDHKKVLTAIRNSPKIQPGEIANFNEWFLDDPGFLQSIIQREGDVGEEDIGITPNMLKNAEVWHGNKYWGGTGSDPLPGDTPDKIALNREKTSDLQYCSLTGIFNGNFQAKQFLKDDNELYESAQNSKKLTIRRFDQVSKNGEKDFNHKNCLMLFNGLYGDYPNKSGDLNVFFVVDVGDRCIKSMSTGDPKIGFPIDVSKGVSLDTFLPFNTYNTYHVHTPTTYSDSADKMGSENPWYDKTFKSQHKTLDQRQPKLPLVRACILTKNIEIDGDESHINRNLFMSDYKATIGWRVPTENNRSSTYQKWEHSDSEKIKDPNYGIYTTYNPKTDNNKPTVLKWLKASKNGEAGSDVSYGRLLKNFGKDYPKKNDDENQVSLEVQKKRSGDAWQILTALNMYKMIKQDSDLKLMRPKSLDARINLFSKLTEDDDKKKYFKKNTIFITSDWPALAFALSLGVNCIMCYFYPEEEEKKCFFSFIFDDEDMGAAADTGTQMPMVVPDKQEQAPNKDGVKDILKKIVDVSNVSDADKQYVLGWIDSEEMLDERFNLADLDKILGDIGKENKQKLHDLIKAFNLKTEGSRSRKSFIKPKIAQKDKAKKKKTKKKNKKSKRKTNRKNKKTKRKTNRKKKTKKKKKTLKKILMNFLN